jgi:hypothetical protein
MLNFRKYEFTERPLDTTGNFYGISKSEFDNHRLENGEQLDLEYRYSHLLVEKLRNHTEPELEDFIEFQLKDIKDKLSWLRNLDILVIKNEITFFDDTPNRTELRKLIPRLIKKYKNNPTETVSAQSNTNLIVLNDSLIIKTKFTISELILLFNLLDLGGLIDLEGITQKKFSEFLSTHFTSLNKPDGFKASSVLQIMKNENHEALKALDDKLISIRTLLKHKNNSI